MVATDKQWKILTGVRISNASVAHLNAQTSLRMNAANTYAPMLSGLTVWHIQMQYSCLLTDRCFWYSQKKVKSNFGFCFEDWYKKFFSSPQTKQRKACVWMLYHKLKTTG